MIAVLCAVIFVISLISLIFFNCSILFSIISAVVSATLFVVEVFMFKGSKLKNIIVYLVLAIGLCICIYAPTRPTQYGSLDQTKMYQQYFDAATQNKSDKANKLYAEFVEKYGENDDVRYIQACSAIEKGNLGEAEEITESFSNKASPFYLMAKEAIILKKYASSEARTEALLPLYINASDNNIDWEYPARHAGGLLFDKGEYAKACYYLSRALTYSEEDDPYLYYYMGAALCEQDLYDKGLPMLDRAYQLGIDESMNGYIAYYVQRSGKAVEQNDK